MTDGLEPLSPEEGVERFLRHREPSVRKSTLRNARTRLNHFLKWCDEREIENLNGLSGRDLDDFIAWRQEDLAAITLQKQLSTIRVALRYWASIEGVQQGLAEKVNAPELPDGAGARDIHLRAERAERILAYLDRYQFASRDHVVLAILWRTGMRRSALRSLDLKDLRPDKHALELRHRIDEGTKLKNGKDGERCVFFGPKGYGIIEEYVGSNRNDVIDKYGRKPLITTSGRPTGDTIYKWVNKITHPCEYGSCPHDREPETCEARGADGYPSKCPSARSPHAIRRGAITYHLNEDTSPEMVSERMDVSLDVLYQHYDVRTELEKMEVRKQHLPEN